MQLFPFFTSIGVLAVIGLNFFGVLPMSLWLGVVMFVVFLVLAFFFPRAMFGVFLATIPLEFVPMFSAGGMDLRWYQILAVAIVVGTVTHKMLSCHSREGGNPGSKKCFFVCLDSRLRGNDREEEGNKKEGEKHGRGKERWVNVAVMAIVLAGFVSAYINGGGAMKQTVVLLSFVFLYFLTRYFVRSAQDVREFLPYLIGSFFVVAISGIAQNILFSANLPHQAVMPGRPNATFSEADWFGLYAGLGVLVGGALVFFVRFIAIRSSKEEMPTKKTKALGVLAYELLIVSLVALIVSVARSAWLATLAGLVVFQLGVVWRFGWRAALGWGLRVGASLFLAVGLVWGLNLTTFELGNRAQSITTGLQEVTIACPEQMNKDSVESLETLTEARQAGCFMINLEEIESYSQEGLSVGKVFREDPNIETRKRVWEASITEIRQHPLFGIGWGNIGAILGTDGRGATLSSSNIFLEFWLGSGFPGFVGIIVIFVALIFRHFRVAWYEYRKYNTENIGGRRQVTRDKQQENGSNIKCHWSTTLLYSLVFLAILITIFVFNLFNSAHFLAITWVVLAFATMLTNAGLKQVNMGPLISLTKEGTQADVERKIC